MRIYCMCRATEVVNAGNERIGLVASGDDGEVLGVALPERPMHIEEIGVTQFLVETDKGRCLFPSMVKVDDAQVTAIREHCPNVDVRECLYCGARIALEG